MKLFKRQKKTDEEKVSKHNKLTLEQYEQGKILQVDNQVDNKEYLKSLGVKHGIEEIPK